MTRGELHEVSIKEVSIENVKKGTTIRLEGYSRDFQKYTQAQITDYIYWYTKHGSFEMQFSKNSGNRDLILYLKALDSNEYKPLPFGHRFAEENSNIKKLFEDYSASSVDYFVKKYMWENKVLEKYPYITYDVVIYVEGDKAKRLYNTQIANKSVKGSGKYKVSDRYGIYLAKDYIPIERKIDWISGFGKGSNSYVMLHGFINCQKFKLTANRGTIVNNNEDVLESIKYEVQAMLEEIDADLYNNDLYTLEKWYDQEKTSKIEETEYSRRKELITKKMVIPYHNINLYEPQSESELFWLFINIYTLHPELFPFEPLDYNTSLGVDLIVRNKTTVPIADSEYWYAELKLILNKDSFNHSFDHLRWIICWDFHNSIKDGTELKSKIGDQVRTMKFIDMGGNRIYFLDSNALPTKISVIRLKEFIKHKLNINFYER